MQGMPHELCKFQRDPHSASAAISDKLGGGGDPPVLARLRRGCTGDVAKCSLLAKLGDEIEGAQRTLQMAKEDIGVETEC